MAKRARNKINLFPYVAKRPQKDGTFKPRFVPGSRERAMGYRGQDLKHENGRWYTLDEASGWALAKQAEIAEQRKTGKKLKSPPVPRGRTVEAMFDAFTKSDEYRGSVDADGNVLVKGLSETTQGGYKRAVKPLKSEPIWQSPPGAIDAIVMKALHKKIMQERGLGMASQALAAIGSAFAWGRLNGWLPKINGQIMESPYRNLKLPKPEVRIRVATVAELTALITAADYTFVDGVALSSVGDAIATGFYSGQRKKDIIEFIDAVEVGQRLALKQSKTDAVVSIPRAPILVDRLARGKERRKTLGLKVEAINLIINERTGGAYSSRQLRDDFALVRDTAIAGVLDVEATAIARELHAAEQRNTPEPAIWILPPCPTLAQPDRYGFIFPDLRDSGVTWLARAECTVPEIGSITGHSMGTIYSILKHYLQIDTHLADNAIRKLIEKMEREGLAV